MPFIRPVKKRSGRRPEAGAARILRNPSRAMDCGRRSACCFGTGRAVSAAEAPNPDNPAPVLSVRRGCARHLSNKFANARVLYYLCTVSD